MSEPFLGELRIFSFDFPPKGWALCNGQLMAINQNQALFSLLGTIYGGDGRLNFALPNLQGRVPFHIGDGHVQGEQGGEVAHSLNISEMPTHYHVTGASSAAAGTGNPVGNFWADGGKNIYNSSTNATMAPQAVSSVGGSQSHDNMSPYLVLNFCIALQGIFPSRN
ncbi:MAG TPA: tail fiber protein [Anaerolineales bacterium]|nr:tail fiber protein [Anaerolineales bacterium]